MSSLKQIKCSHPVHYCPGLQPHADFAPEPFPLGSRFGETHENKPDISRADFFALLSAQRNHSIEEIAARLVEVSSKAKENGPQYARLTAENAMAANERQRRSRA
jgi:hypothetical protein